MSSLLLILIFYWSWFGGIHPENIPSNLEVNWRMLVDSNQVPDYYIAHIKTPVCEDERCYDIEVLIQFDLLGQFVQLDTLTGKGLTKLDHIPFTSVDYGKLNDLLADEESPLGFFEKEALITNTRHSELDGFTGATIKEVRDIVVDGGLYSCYTLWHLVHNDLRESVKTKTKDLLNRRLIQKMMGFEEERYNYFIINNLEQDQWSEYVEELLELLTFNQGYFLKKAIEKCPSTFLERERVQVFFANEFATLNYFTQVAFLRKLNGIELIPEIRTVLKNELNAVSSLKNQLISELIM